MAYIITKWYTLKTGKLAPHCDGAVEVTMEGTKLLVTVVMNKNPDENKERFPLGIDISPLKLDLEHSPGELSILGASVGTMLAGIPFEGPIGWVRIGYIDGEYVVNMTESQAAHSIMDLHVAGTATKINMIEAWGKETPMDIIKGWMRLAQEAIAELCQIENDLLAKCTITPKTITTNKPADDMIAAIRDLLSDDKLDALHSISLMLFIELLKKITGMPHIRHTKMK